MYFILSIIVICLLCYVLWDTYFNRKPTDPPEVSKKLPFIGHSLLFIGSSEKLFNTFRSLSKECMEKGGVLKGSIGFRTVYGVSDPEDCVTISNACFKRDLFHDFLKPFLGEGLLTGNVTTWKRHRKLLNPAFSQRILNNFIGVFNDQSRRLVDQMSEMIGRPFNHEHLLRINNLETICITASGLNCDGYKKVQQQYLTCLTTGLNLILQRLRRFWLHNDFIYSLSNLKRRQDEIRGDFLNLSNLIVQKKKHDMKMNDCKERGKNLVIRRRRLFVKYYVDNPPGGAAINISISLDQLGKVKSFLDHILELSERTGCFTDDEIREETDTILAAGHDTAAYILTCTFILLGSHLDVQEKVYEEIQKVVGDRDVTKDDLSALVYTDAVLKETMRLYPVSPVLTRYVEREVKLKNCTLQPNNGVFILVWGLHRDPIWGPDAHEFKPERWLNTETLPDMNYYFAGFGLGRRACIGKVYAMMSMKTILVHVIRKFKLSSDISKMILKFEFMSKVHDGDHLTISPRNLA